MSGSDSNDQERKVKIENENTFRTVLRQQQGVNLFLGAGFSILANDIHGNPLPIGAELADELAKQFDVSFAAQLPLPQLCQYISASRKEELTRFLRTRYRVSTFDDRYGYLDKLNIDTIFSTNIDDLVDRIYVGSNRNYVNDVYTRGVKHGDRHAVDVVALHGHVRNERRPLTFGILELATASEFDRDGWALFRQKLRDRPTLFWGNSIQDAGTLEVLGIDALSQRDHEDKWIVIRPSSHSDVSVEYFRSLGFQIILATTSDMLDYLSDVETIPMLHAPGSSSENINALFPEYSIPDKTDLSVRSIQDFYAGIPPRWYDIYFGMIHRTRHYNTIRDLLNAGKNVLITGIPATGKTTLLMDTAAHYDQSSIKLKCDLMPKEKAALVAKAVGSEVALICIDNFAESVDALNLLSSHPNIRVVAADGDYNFEIVRHRIDLSQFTKVDVTKLDPSDVQACIEQIPLSIRQTRPRRQNPNQASLFDLIEASVMQSTLSDRFDKVLAQLTKASVDMHDLFLMIAYVSSCRSPVSMDMVYSFLSEITSDYERVYDMIRRIGQMVAEYVGVDAIEEQDYYTMRSPRLGEVALSRASGSSIRRMLLRFHNNVSPFRICRYDVFQQHGHDNDLMVKAFSDWKEGASFYERLYARDGSFYMLQHGALFLSKKEQFTEAFEMIDRSMIASNNRSWTVKNSYAIILFEANKAHYRDSAVRPTLDESMRILAQCYHSDKRIFYHVRRYARQAVELAGLYSNDYEVYTYLMTSLSWLIEERSKPDFPREVPYLIRTVERTLRQYT